MTARLLVVIGCALLTSCGGSDFRAFGSSSVVDSVDAGDGPSFVPSAALDAGDDAPSAEHHDDGGGASRSSGGSTMSVVGAGGLRATGGTSSSGGRPNATGGTSSSGGAGSAGGAGGAPTGGTSSSGVCPANPRSDCPNYCPDGDVTVRCCEHGHCGCLTDTVSGRVCL